MAKIDIYLLPNKQTKVTWEQGYSIVEGENNATEIGVRYPPGYADSPLARRYAYMKNAKGEYAAQELFGSGAIKTFTLPASMTYAGTTTIVFYSESENEKIVWMPVEIPIAATHMDYKKVATASEDILQKAIKAVEELREFLKQKKE